MDFLEFHILVESIVADETKTSTSHRTSTLPLRDNFGNFPSCRGRVTPGDVHGAVRGVDFGLVALVISCRQLIYVANINLPPV